MADQRLLSAFLNAKRRTLERCGARHLHEAKLKFSNDVRKKRSYRFYECLNRINKVPSLYVEAYGQGRIKILGFYHHSSHHPGHDLKYRPLRLFMTSSAVSPLTLQALHYDCLKVCPSSGSNRAKEAPNCPAEFDLSPEQVSALAEEYRAYYLRNWGPVGGHGTEKFIENYHGDDTGLLRKGMVVEEDLLIRLPAVGLALGTHVVENMKRIRIVCHGPVVAICAPTRPLVEELFFRVKESGLQNVRIRVMDTLSLAIGARMHVTQDLWFSNSGWFFEHGFLQYLMQSWSKDLESELEEFIRILQVILKEVNKSKSFFF